MRAKRIGLAEAGEKCLGQLPALTPSRLWLLLRAGCSRRLGCLLAPKVNASLRLLRRLNHEFAGRGDGLYVAQCAAHLDQAVAFHRLERSRKIAGRVAGEFRELTQ